uniref:EVE domain-containing protein n=1 Tax=Oryza glumipatula TaxID=40148 RepID=A0A0E0AWT8_9ORYZ
MNSASATARPSTASVALRRGDRYLFYHSGTGAASRHIVGVVEVAREWYEGEGEAASGGAVDVRAVGEFRLLVVLVEIKIGDGVRTIGVFWRKVAR